MNFKLKSTGRFDVDVDGWELQCFFKKSDIKRLYVLLCGAVNRDKRPLPIFQRWSWVNDFPGNVICVSDPTLKLNDKLRLAWYMGIEKSFAIECVSELIGNISDVLGVERSDTYFYGSSGGGTASMMLAGLMENSVGIAVNPQVLIPKFRKEAFEKMMSVSYPGRDINDVVSTYPQRFSVVESLKNVPNAKILYVQNTLDINHYESHYKYFCKKFEIPVEGGRSLHRSFFSYVYSRPGGHVPESREMLKDILDAAFDVSAGGEHA